MGDGLEAIHTVIYPVLCTPGGGMGPASQREAANQRACSCVTAPLLQATADPNLCFISPPLYQQLHITVWDSGHSPLSNLRAIAHAIIMLG